MRPSTSNTADPPDAAWSTASPHEARPTIELANRKTRMFYIASLRLLTARPKAPG